MERVKLEWDCIGYSVDTPNSGVTGRASGGMKQILSNLSGSAKPGQVLAIMGSSGSGKSTLLDVLSGRLTADSVTVSLNPNPLSCPMNL